MFCIGKVPRVAVAIIATGKNVDNVGVVVAEAGAIEGGAGAEEDSAVVVAAAVAVEVGMTTNATMTGLTASAASTTMVVEEVELGAEEVASTIATIITGVVMAALLPALATEILFLQAHHHKLRLLMECLQVHHHRDLKV